jgi:hypothetical protein
MLGYTQIERNDGKKGGFLLPDSVVDEYLPVLRAQNPEADYRIVDDKTIALRLCQILN